MADEEVRRTEVTYPTAFATVAKAGGARVLAMTAVGANSQSSTKYLRTFGDKEKSAAQLEFDFLGLYRPAMILGNSNTPSALGVVMPLFHWALPSHYHSIHKNEWRCAPWSHSRSRYTSRSCRAMAPRLRRSRFSVKMEPFFVVEERVIFS